MQGQLNGIPVPEFVWATPGHYSVVALLPEDHTFAKGSLFVLAPGTKCVVFDMDGRLFLTTVKLEPNVDPSFLGSKLSKHREFT